MKTRVLAALLFCSATAIAGPEPGSEPEFPPNLAVDLDAPGAVRAEISVLTAGLKEPLRYEFTAQDGHLGGGVFAAPGDTSYFSVTAFDGRGEPVYRGEGKAEIDKEYTREISIPIGGDDKDPATLRLATEILDATLEPGYGDGWLIKATLFDAFDNHVALLLEDLEWELPPGFEVLPYSCFLNSLCIELPKPDGTKLFCNKLGSCPKPLPDPRPKYRFVAVGKNHTCAITDGNDMFCWGLNNLGQLGAPTGFCQAGLLCSLAPVAVQCPAGEVCKFRWVTAGGDHTCAADTNGKAWCWGEEGNPAAGKSLGLGSTSPVHRPVPAFNRVGTRADFVSIDTHTDHTCGLSVMCIAGVTTRKRSWDFIPTRFPVPTRSPSTPRCCRPAAPTSRSRSATGTPAPCRPTGSSIAGAATRRGRSASAACRSARWSPSTAWCRCSTARRYR